MSEELQGSESGLESAIAGADPLPAAMALASASSAAADEFLFAQRGLIQDQRHHLHEQLTQLRLGIWERRLGVLLRVATAFVGLAIASGLAFMVWSAAHSNGLLIEPFSVPPELAAKGLRFADPLEGWGEALMAKNQSHLALTKFKEAEKYAPNWGRLHLKWGEALGYAGKPDEAKKHFALATGLDLTPGEKAELSRVRISL